VRITEVKTIILRQPVVNDGIADGSQDDLIIRVETDEGIVGIGEVDSAPEIVRAAIDAPNSHSNSIGLRHILLGRDPFDDGIWHRMYRGSVYFGRRGVAMHAMSGIDLALWDIKGKKLGKPVSELLGTPLRQKIKAYASTLMPETEDEVSARIDDLGRVGFRAVKLGWGPIGRDESRDVRLCSAAIKAASGAVDVLVDAGLGYDDDVRRAIRVARKLEDLGVVWLEEPFEPDNFEFYSELADAVEIRVAAGEHESTAWGFRELIERGHVDIVQPDVTRCGGLTEALKIARLAADHGIDCVPHAWKSGVIKAASLHLNAVLSRAIYQEYCVANTPINQSLTVQTLPLDANGFVAIPTGPGLGVDLDPEIIDRYRVS
jgi:L-alanine-DL-glutamate epimerase-like enolase superfamily enzyme